MQIKQKQSLRIKRTTQRFRLNQNKHEKAITLIQNARKKSRLQIRHTIKLHISKQKIDLQTNRKSNEFIYPTKIFKSKEQDLKNINKEEEKTDIQIKEEYSKKYKKTHL
jgi:hypothetical protein